ncbi:surface carbohydrate biosynthesis protein [Ornithinibacillus scapharcae]|uniref:surface carbohydrate biosynthesis protein n=1 Tax=Ornithinibacillus scapharcae TaxID=1147159 RepID=UPI000225AB41|nr:surface carbohydrate biosynthesis protein [Ornithinibacillus scapharcae]
MGEYKGWLYIPIEVKVRERDAKLLVAYYAAREGYIVIIGDHYMVENAADKLPKGIFYSKGYPHGFRKRVLTRASQNGHRIVELDEEGLLIKDTMYLQDRMLKNMLQLVTKEFCWGPNQYEVISKAYPDLAKKCVIVGNPRFDLLTPKYKQIYNKEAQLLRNKYGDFILINTRFTQYNNARGKMDTPYYKYIKQLYYYFIDLIKELSERFPNETFILRPHPGEDIRSYHKIFSNEKNVRVIHEGNIVKWLMAAKVIIHNGCTSAIEGYYLDKPVISYIPTKETKLEIPNQLGIRASTINEVCKAIEQINNQAYTMPKPEVLDLYCYWQKDKYAYHSIIEAFDDIAIPTRDISGRFVIDRGVLTKSMRKRRFSLTKQEIEDFFSLLDGIEGSLNELEIVPIGQNLFKIKAL